LAQVRQLVPSAKMGLAYGVTETVGGTAVILAPIMAGLLYTQNPTLMYAISFGLIAISIFVSGRFSPKPGNHEASPDPSDAQTATAPPGGSEG